MKNITNHQLENEIVYSTPKEERDNQKREYIPKKKYVKKYDQTNEEENIEETKPTVDCDSDGFEIISEKKIGEPKKKQPYKKREYDDNDKRKNFEKKDRPVTGKGKTANGETEAPVAKKETVSSNLNKVATLESVII